MILYWGGVLGGELIAKNGYKVLGVPDTPEAHNSVYRGKEHTVEDLSAKVLANDWSDIFIGDYFRVSFTTEYGTVTNEKCLVAGINYFQHCSWDTPTPHLVMIPANTFGVAAMNPTNTTEGAYMYSDMHATVLPVIAEALKGAIGESHVIRHIRAVSGKMNATTPSMAGMGLTGASVHDGVMDYSTSCLFLLSEPMVYGTKVWSSSAVDIGEMKQQLPIFCLTPTSANIFQDWWLSAVVDSSRFAHVGMRGNAGGVVPASTVCGIRPFFLFH